MSDEEFEALNLSEVSDSQAYGYVANDEWTFFQFRAWLARYEDDTE